MKGERVSSRVLQALREASPGAIVAVWRGGDVTVHHGEPPIRRDASGAPSERPLTSFVSNGAPRSLAVIRVQIQRAHGIGRF